LSDVKKINIAIDGHSSCGKGTLAKHLANSLGYVFIESGAMYRAVTLYLLTHKTDISDWAAVENALPGIHIHFGMNAETARNDVWLNGENVETQIRNMEVAAEVSNVAKIPAVRRVLVALQQQMGAEKGVVMDGRDIGTVVFPNAELKLFMTASVEVRAKRRFAELERDGIHTTYKDVLHNLTERDRIDSTREDSPLTQSDVYKLLDNSNLSKETQNEIALNWVKEVLYPE